MKNIDKKIKDELSELLTFWFGPLQNGLSGVEQTKLWYGATEEQDKEMTEQYLPLYQQLIDWELAQYHLSSSIRLAMVILFDQLSRNFFRGQARAFTADNMALGLCLEGIELGIDKQYALSERIFFYHPLEHSEELEHQELCVELMKALLDEQPADRISLVQRSLDFACLHRDIIQDFGRFPHRNQAMGRQSTEEELQYLSQGGQRFGQ